MTLQLKNSSLADEFEYRVDGERACIPDFVTVQWEYLKKIWYASSPQLHTEYLRSTNRSTCPCIPKRYIYYHCAQLLSEKNSKVYSTIHSMYNVVKIIAVISSQLTIQLTQNCATKKGS